MLVDTHCHLDYEPLYNNLDQVVERAKLQDVLYLLSISTTIDSFLKIKEIVKRYENIYGTVGIHPHEAKNYSDFNHNKLINCKKECSKVIGIGETGLDFYYNHSDKTSQKKLFIEHIRAASELNIPIIVHSRNAEKETLEILESEIKNNNLKVLMHCFTGSRKFSHELLNLGCFISLSGIITFKNSENLIEVIESLPLDRLLIETDSPYLSPFPLRGKSNEPSHLIHTAKKLSLIKKINLEDIKTITTKNFFTLFAF